MPAFARKYQMSCKTCHAPFPKLKPYGEEFAANGFTLKDKEAPRYFADTGDEKVSLIRDLPFALRLEGFASLNNGNGRTLDLSTPYLIKLLSGGELFRSVSYYFYFFFSERGKVAGLEDAFLMFNDVIGGPRHHRRPVPGLRSAVQGRAALVLRAVQNIQDQARLLGHRPDL